MYWFDEMSRIVTNLSRVYSPVILSNEWPKLGRLLFTLLCSVLGVSMNGFFVASFFVEPGLNKIGYVFMACLGMSDLVISTSVLPTATVVLLSGEWDTDPVCYALQFVTEAGTYSYSLFFMMSAIESYYRLCKATSDYEFLISMRIGLFTVILFTITFLTAAVGVYMELDYDYCHRSHAGNFIFRVTTSVIFYVIPFVVIFFCLANNACRIRNKARKHNHYKRSLQYETETTTNNLNIMAYFLFVAAWVPYLVVVYLYPDTTDSKYYHSVWIGIFRSVVTSFLYGSMDRNFRRAFAHLFNYCCCKSTLSGSFASRHRRALECKAVGDVRVHIMHQAMNANSPQRGASSSRETQEL
ncbi:melatonin receptor type 1A-like [Cydia pomonella]|uniref:melatonin receptor type 1A-like n=1 Tax=Cydia pomonella TaxID=82600 RepID=UPI002ADDDB7F|nr:melatonin receptor type 1A-like [Cydia pomonella]XP_061711664.1 melatonin receptor type 1A-like [Cydia pomonella]